LKYHPNEWLEKAYKDHEVEMYWLKVEPPFEPLHDDPRWQVMLLSSLAPVETNLRNLLQKRAREEGRAWDKESYLQPDKSNSN